MRNYYGVLSIAGSDCSGGAGIQADIKTISAIGCYAMTAITAVTVQNTTGVSAVQGIEPTVVEGQIDMVTADIPPLAIKTGMLYDATVTAAVARALKRYLAVHPDVPVVVDPVMVSTSGAMLIEPDAVKLLREEIFPLATLITPNIQEAKALTGSDDPAVQWRMLREAGCRSVLLKGGDSERTDIKTDYLGMDGEEELLPIVADAVPTRNTHGTGCTLSSAIASYLALGYGLRNAVERGKLYVARALQAGAFVTAGSGHGPVNHFFSPRRLKNFNPDR
ncbi:MAG: bifunctional hydroxymethylpyrimidine kinase/phosphomethylpyrimidine kinase [Bacteroides sp.]|nr:bifunctional hydroxymethylpyrimidine kinase/phosphomethylpyrimidine kinase [Bacteroidales bacterium]MBD5250854.1 bifunctional hydroxymethylpyrimidine kinase/phosphomethylpyrimidine kinase [Barnesiella sp.]MBD5343670.1 bifunctional hydroxymethylpyrimidine kinase/phosphomethylpyrimidine kinase [Bacteroides sp.]MBD5367937.1 bifunctional hydroxymethylpyrimidine kinase/phosphomethylpyrimidine kinase [Bacteroides sp.]